MTTNQTIPGTTGDPEGTKTPSFGIVPGTPADKGGEPSEDEKRYTQKELDAYVHAAKSEAGREAKRLSGEVENLKADLDLKSGEIEDIETERQELRRRNEDLSSSDPQKFNLIAEDRKLKDKELKLRSEERRIKAENVKLERKMAASKQYDAAILCEEVAESYGEVGNHKLLKDICAKTGASEENTIRDIAKTLWGEPGVQTTQTTTTQQTLKTIPGNTPGPGKVTYDALKGKDLRKMTPGERREHQKQLASARASL